MKRRTLLLSGLPLGATGCAAPGTTFMDMTIPTASDSSEIPAGMGIVVTRINLNDPFVGDRPPLRFTLERKPSIGLKSGLFTLQKGENFHAVVLKPGDYVWSEIYLGGYGSVFKDEFAFPCVEKQVTYIGDVDIDLNWTSTSYKLRFSDRTSLAGQKFSSAYPKMAASHKMASRVVQDPRQKS